MGAAPVVGAALGAANVVGGIAKGSAERRTQNEQAKQQAAALQASLLAQRQQIIDQSALEEMQLALARQFANQQAAMAQLQRQGEASAFDASMKLQGLDRQMQVTEGRFQNEAELANAQLGQIDANSQADAKRFTAEQQQLQMNSQAAGLEGQVARGVQQGTQQAQQQLAEGARARDTIFVSDPNSDSMANARTASLRQQLQGIGEQQQSFNVSQDEAAIQAQYMRGIAETLKQMGISEADAMEAAAATSMALAQGGYDLNNLKLDQVLAAAQGEENIQRASFSANQEQQKQAEAIQQQAQDFSFKTAETLSSLQRSQGLKAIEDQAKYGTTYGASSPGLLGGALQVASGAYNVYQQFQGMQQPKTQQQSFGVSNVRMPSLLATSTAFEQPVTQSREDYLAQQSFNRNVRLPSLLR